ncbi:hypothetical protein [Streptomyces sp. NPDC002722]|uniref:hypothetical protein n=1 Tax=unclassified Streptomyces TaxID=2593676 RepID=UPI00331DCE6B
MRGLLVPLEERKNGWMLADRAGRGERLSRHGHHPARHVVTRRVIDHLVHDLVT